VRVPLDKLLSHLRASTSLTVFTIKWRDAEGKLQYKYVDNFVSDKTKSSDACYVVTVWKAHLRSRWLRHQLGKKSEDVAKRKLLITELKQLDSFDGYFDEFKHVTDIIRTGDNGGHLLNKACMFFESTVMEEYGIRWITHTLAKRHGYNLCDAHGAAVKKHINSYAVADCRPETAHDFANVINNCSFDYEGRELAFTYNARTRAYPISNINRAEKVLMFSQLRGVAGIQSMCEFQYNVLNDDNELVWLPGVVRMRECSGVITEKYEVRDTVYRGAACGRICSQCTSYKQRPMYHKRDILTGLPSACEFSGGAKGALRNKQPNLPSSNAFAACKASPNPRHPSLFGQFAWIPADVPSPQKKKRGRQKQSVHSVSPAKSPAKKKSKNPVSKEAPEAPTLPFVIPSEKTAASAGDDADHVVPPIEADVLPVVFPSEKPVPPAAVSDDGDGDCAAVSDDSDDGEGDCAAVSDDSDDGEGDCAQFLVEKIMGVVYDPDTTGTGVRNRIYRVRWSGYTAKDDTYQAEGTLPADMIEAFKRSNLFETCDAYDRRQAASVDAQDKKKRAPGPRGRRAKVILPPVQHTVYEEQRMHTMKENANMMALLLGSVKLIPERSKRSYKKAEAMEPSNRRTRSMIAPESQQAQGQPEESQRAHGQPESQQQAQPEPQQQQGHPESLQAQGHPDSQLQQPESPPEQPGVDSDPER
jgi:hypothetical protein